jgi:hypothetical protein
VQGIVKATLVAMLSFATPVGAQGIAACKRIADDAERLRCFDRLPDVDGSRDQAMAPRIAARPTPAGPGFAVAESSVRKLLKNPVSAHFIGLRQQGDAVCGFVNARNAAGGYTGAKLFVYVGSRGEAHILDQPEESEVGEGSRNAYETHCR